jgi:D-arabinose 1-dehydrogenase-like Zn-dependent alcohol dehydrogenase
VTTAWHALTGRAALRPGEWLGIWGGGGVGVAALILGRAMGARVALADVVPEKLSQARTLGAEVVIDARGEDPAEAMRAATGGGVHLAIEALGIPQTTANALRSLRKLGRMVQVGMPAGDHLTMALPWDAVYSGQLAIYGTRGMPAHRYPALARFPDRDGARPFADDRAPRAAVGRLRRAGAVRRAGPAGRRGHHRFRLVRGQGASPS